MFKKDEKMWFGTKDYMTWITPPLAGADSSPAAWGSEGTLLNGGGYAFNSFNSHKTYNYAWSGGSTRQEAQLMKSFADGTYGRGRIFFQEPNIYDTNVLPARLADPSLTADYEGPELVPNVATTTVATSGFEVNGLPVRTMNYPVGAALPVLNADNVLAQDNFVPVPDGKSLLVQAFYAPAPGSTGLGIYVVEANTGGEPAATGVRLTPNTNSGAVTFQVFDKGPGVIGYYIFIGRSTGVITGNMQVAAIHARIADTGETMIGEDTWMGGQGHSGVRFTGKPTYVTRSGINGGQIEYAATFKEVQD